LENTLESCNEFKEFLATPNIEFKESTLEPLDDSITPLLKSIRDKKLGSKKTLFKNVETSAKKPKRSKKNSKFLS
jgi:hypothetical protein